MTEQEMKARIAEKRALIRWSDEDFESDQMLKRPQPPLTKAPVSDTVLNLPRDFDQLTLEHDLVKLLYARRSNRVFTGGGMDLRTLAYLCWAQQGVKSIRGNNYATLRTVPSGGARHPFELYMVVQRVEGLAPGLYHYLPLTHQLELLQAVDVTEPAFREKVSYSLCDQLWAVKADVIFYYSIVPYRGEWRYAHDAHRVMLIDAGHVSQNLYLACGSVRLGTCAIAAVDTDAASKLFGVDGEEEYVFYSLPVGTVAAANEADEQAFYAFLKEE